MISDRSPQPTRKDWLIFGGDFAGSGHGVWRDRQRSAMPLADLLTHDIFCFQGGEHIRAQIALVAAAYLTVLALAGVYTLGFVAVDTSHVPSSPPADLAA